MRCARTGSCTSSQSRAVRRPVIASLTVAQVRGHKALRGMIPHQQRVAEVHIVARIGLRQLDRLQVVHQLLLHLRDSKRAGLLALDVVLDAVLLQLVVLAPVAHARRVAKARATGHLLRRVEVGEVVHREARPWQKSNPR